MSSRDEKKRTSGRLGILRGKGREESWVRMDELSHTDSTAKSATMQHEEEVVDPSAPHASSSAAHLQPQGEDAGTERGRENRRSYSHTHFRVYKRRWFGLLQLVLLNIVVSWDVCIPAFSDLSRRLALDLIGKYGWKLMSVPSG